MAIIETRKLEKEKVEQCFSFMHVDDDAEVSVMCKSPEKLKHLTNAIGNGKLVHFVSKGDWSMHDLVVELLKEHSPADLYFTTYALREFSVRQLINAVERKQLLSVNILIDTKAKSRTPDTVQLAEMNMTRIHLTSVHAKVCVLRTATASITINSSANWTSNPRIESGTVSMNPLVADFHIDWIEKTMANAEAFK